MKRAQYKSTILAVFMLLYLNKYDNLEYWKQKTTTSDTVVKVTLRYD